jgi:lysozyme family protein
MNFDDAFTKLIGNEGGYVDNPQDPGGETKYGISRNSYPNEDIKNMTLIRAKFLYARDYWSPAGCNLLPEGMKFQVFDMAVNSGVKTALKTLQKALGVVPDGVLGPITFKAVLAMPEARFIARFNGVRLSYFTSLETWSTFGRGWANRIATNLMEA